MLLQLQMTPPSQLGQGGAVVMAAACTGSPSLTQVTYDLWGQRSGLLLVDCFRIIETRELFLFCRQCQKVAWI